MNNLPGGLWPVMITPFLYNNSLDIEGLKKVTDMYLMSGANGMFANCLSSEMFQLTSKERLEITKTVVNHCNGKVPVVATGTFYYQADKNVEFIKEIYDLGVDAVILISNILVEPEEGDDVLKMRIEEIMNGTGNIPLGIYECPIPYKRVIHPDMMGWLAKTNRFLYHKDTTCDIKVIKDKLDRIKGSDYHLFNADTRTALDSMRLGARGMSPISGNFYPEIYGFLLKLFRAGESIELSSLNSKLSVMDRLAHDHYPWLAKEFLKKRGLNICSNTRIPMVKLNVSEKNNIQALFKMFQLVMNEYNIKSVI